MQLYKLMFPNGKSYIGITSKTAAKRFKHHCNPANNKNPCQKAIQKYGKENIKVIVLAAVDNWELLCLAEQEAIEKFNTYAPNGKGYNLTLGGEGNLTVLEQGEERIARDRKLQYKLSSQWSRRNKDKCRISSLKWYEKNKNKILSYCKEYREKNREEIIRKKREYYALHKHEISEKTKIKRLSNIVTSLAKEKAYRDSNKDMVLLAQKKYRDANKEKIAAGKKEWGLANKDKLKAAKQRHLDKKKMSIITTNT